MRPTSCRLKPWTSRSSTGPDGHFRKKTASHPARSHGHGRVDDHSGRLQPEARRDARRSAWDKPSINPSVWVIDFHALGFGAERNGKHPLAGGNRCRRNRDHHRCHGRAAGRARKKTRFPGAFPSKNAAQSRNQHETPGSVTLNSTREACRTHLMAGFRPDRAGLRSGPETTARWSTAKVAKKSGVCTMFLLNVVLRTNYT